MKNIFSALLIVLSAASEAVESNSLLLNIEMKGLKRSFHTQSSVYGKVYYFASLRQGISGKHSCSGYLINRDYVATRPYCLFRDITGSCLESMIQNMYAIFDDLGMRVTRKVLEGYYPKTFNIAYYNVPDDLALLKLNNLEGHSWMTNSVEMVGETSMAYNQPLSMLLWTYHNYVTMISNVQSVSLSYCNINPHYTHNPHTDHFCVLIPLTTYFNTAVTNADEIQRVKSGGIVPPFASGSPIFLEDQLIAIVGEYSVHDGINLYLHCMHLEKYKTDGESSLTNFDAGSWNRVI